MGSPPPMSCCLLRHSSSPLKDSRLQTNHYYFFHIATSQSNLPTRHYQHAGVLVVLPVQIRRLQRRNSFGVQRNLLPAQKVLGLPD